MAGVARERKWTEEEDRHLMRLRAELGPRWLDIAEQIGGRFNGNACRVHYADLQRNGLVPLVVPRHDPHQNETPAEAWDRIKQRTSRDVARHKSLRFVDVHVADSKPILISKISDQHIRETGPVDLVRMEEDATLIRETDGAYAILGGDGIDNHIKHLSAMVHGGTNAKEEWKAYDHYLGMFTGKQGSKILAMISGNHDDWTVDKAGVNMAQILAERNNLFFAPDEVLVRLAFGNETYRIKVRHQYQFNSQFNKTHSIKRLWEMGEDDFDVGVVCHLHEAAMEPFFKHGQLRWAMRPGSYQLTSAYSRQRGFNQSSPTCPSVVYWPDQHKTLGFFDLRDAVIYLKAVR
jgi:hypothetical protein